MITTSYNVIGKRYKYDNSIENISRIASITSGQFTNDNGHQGNIERDLMHDLNLCFPEKGQKIAGCIARIVIQWKIEMISI